MAAHLHPELAEAGTSTSAADPVATKTPAPRQSSSCSSPASRCFLTVFGSPAAPAEVDDGQMCFRDGLSESRPRTAAAPAELLQAAILALHPGFSPFARWLCWANTIRQSRIRRMMYGGAEETRLHPRIGGGRLGGQTPAPGNAPVSDPSESITPLKIDLSYFCVSKLACAASFNLSVNEPPLGGGGQECPVITAETDPWRPSTTGPRFSIRRPLASHRAASAGS